MKNNDWLEEYNNILHDWFGRIIRLDLDNTFIEKIKNNTGHWVVRSYELEDFIQQEIDKAYKQGKIDGINRLANVLGASEEK